MIRNIKSYALVSLTLSFLFIALSSKAVFAERAIPSAVMTIAKVNMPQVIVLKLAIERNMVRL